MAPGPNCAILQITMQEPERLIDPNTDPVQAVENCLDRAQAITIGVVTDVPDGPGDFIEGNLSMPGPLYDQKYNPVNPLVMLSLRTPVFHRGEILVMDADGREVGGLGRKPSKWDVTVKIVGSIEVAARLSREIGAVVFTTKAPLSSA